MDKLSEVYFAAGHIIVQMEQWMQRRDNRHTSLRFKKEDKVRLLKLRTWSLRHHLSIDEILNMIMPRLMERSKFKKKYGFDITVKVLTGLAARKVLLFQINKTYPGGENILIWKETEKEVQVRNEKIEMMEGLPVKPKLTAVMGDNESIEDYVERYTKSVMAERSKERRVASQRWRRRKNYRNNPW